MERVASQPVTASESAAAGDGRSETALHILGERLDWQQTLFDAQPHRRALLSLHSSWPLTAQRLRFHRNHAIEASLAVLRPFLEFSGIRGDLVVSDYDDSLSFGELDEADAEVVWLDFDRFSGRLSPAALADWLASRLHALRERTTAPILVLDWDGPSQDADEFAQQLAPAVREIGSVRLADRSKLLAEMGKRYFDAERAEVTGTRMSGNAAVQTARLLGLRWLPALLEPRLKAVVVDLDNTLYRGVLGEDGPSRVTLTNGHSDLQRELLALRDSGLFLALASRNEPEDVRQLFDKRPDFPLQWEDFSARAIGWHPKSESLQSIADELRVDTGALLFVDDNAGELLQTGQQLPRVRLLHAPQDVQHTVFALGLFPGVWRFDGTAEDAVRIADLRANEEREHALSVASLDIGAYYRELEVRLRVFVHRPEQVARVADLSGKTNQFNLAFSRYGEADVQRLLASDRWQISTAGLEDRLSDSGVIAMAASERSTSTLIVHELCVSCRALGRQLEDLLIAQMLVSGPAFDGVENVAFAYVDGPRNQPARDWLRRFSGAALGATAELTHVVVSASSVKAASVNADVTIEVLT